MVCRGTINCLQEDPDEDWQEDVDAELDSSAGVHLDDDDGNIVERLPEQDSEEYAAAALAEDAELKHWPFQDIPSDTHSKTVCIIPT